MPYHCPFLSVFAVALAALPAAAADMTGEQIYAKQCASCHGVKGEGSKKYKHPLAGDKSVSQLADVIARTMPEDNPESLSAADARKVAAYTFENFYSPAARGELAPPRAELARLTVPQYRNAVADVIGAFRPQTAKWGDARGLKGEYYAGRNFDQKKRVLERTDPVVAFDWGTAGAVPDQTDPHEFSARWNGSVLPPETGRYEFVVRTDHAARLWVNDPAKPLIDAWVKSGPDTEHRGSIYLLAGRPVSVRLEFSKAKQGVQDKKVPPKPLPASLSLAWQLPRGVVVPIPAHDLSTAFAPELYAVETPFPPDDRSLGWERGTTVSKAWDAAATDAALETAGYVVAKLDQLAGTKAGAPDRTAKLKDFARRFAERAFRRPLTPDQQRLYVDHQFEVAADPEAAVKRVVLLALKSPRFLYREVGGGPDGFDTAARLSFALWDAPPDKELLDAAAAGRLATREQVAKQAERMLDDPRARAKLRSFLHHWLKVDQPTDVAKDAKRFPGFDPAVAADLKTSLDLQLDDAVGPNGSDFRQLLLADEVYLNGRLAKFYGASLPADAPFTKVKLNPEHRAGAITHPYLMAAFAYTGTTSPIHRGVFLARGVLGLNLRPPQDAFSPLAEDLHPTLTTRERVALQTKPAACAGCHSLINPLGFTLEHFDAVGRYREKDNARPVDATGGYKTRDGKAVTFAGERDLAKFLAASDEVVDSFTEQLFHHLIQQPVAAYGPETLESLRRGFAGGGFSIKKLAVDAATTAALTPRGDKLVGK